MMNIKHQTYFEAIVTDDEDTVHKNIIEDKTLINVRFDFAIPQDKELRKSDKKAGDIQPHYPLTVAACNGSVKVLQLLLEFKADMTTKDGDGYNVLHMLLLEASKGSQNYPKLHEIYKIFEDHEVIEALLMEESDDGLRPLEMAACLGLMKFTQMIMNTPGVYLDKQVVKGNMVYKWYNITEYEKPGFKSRRAFSPLFFLQKIDYKDLGNSETTAFFKWPVLQMWIKNKVFCNYPLAIVWMFIRIFYTFLTFSNDNMIKVTPIYSPQMNNESTDSSNDTYANSTVVSPRLLNSSNQPEFVVPNKMERFFLTIIGPQHQPE